MKFTYQPMGTGIDDVRLMNELGILASGINDLGKVMAQCFDTDDY